MSYRCVQKYIEKSAQAAVRALTQEQVEAVVKNFRDAGYGDVEVSDETMSLIGIQPFRKEFDVGVRGWECFCFKTYLAITGSEPENCSLMGRGFRSQYFGKIVGEAVKAVNSGATVQA